MRQVQCWQQPSASNAVWASDPQAQDKHAPVAIVVAPTTEHMIAAMQKARPKPACTLLYVLSQASVHFTYKVMQLLQIWWHAFLQWIMRYQSLMHTASDLMLAWPLMQLMLLLAE